MPGDHRNDKRGPWPESRGVVAYEAPMTIDIAVIITCHRPYLRWLPEALAAIERQAPPFVERVVVFDGCEPPNSPPDGWRYVAGDWGNPTEGRNAGTAATGAPWLIFWDADNVMPEGYAAAAARAIESTGSDVAILYPDIQLCDEHLVPQRLSKMPQWDYWGLRAENYIDTASAWRREALEIVGGWTNRNRDSFDDYALALDVTAAGWKAARLEGPPILMRMHDNSRGQTSWRNGTSLRNLWQSRSMAIVTLLAGRDDVFERWHMFLLQAELPPRAALYVVDNSSRSEFTRHALAVCEEIATTRRLVHLDYALAGGPYRPRSGEPYSAEGRHLHVARLYATVLPRVREDLVLTLEDDVEPPRDALPRLGIEVGFPSLGKIGAIAAAYPMPQNPTTACAGEGDDRWGPSIPLVKLPPEPLDIGFVGGGCTIWANWALQELPVNFWWQQGLGWDAALCLQMRRRGYRVRLHGGVRCEHHLHGRLSAAPVARRFDQASPATSRAMVPANVPQLETPPRATHEAPKNEIRCHAERWIAPDALGSTILPYLPTFPFDGYINEQHRRLATSAVRGGHLIDLGIAGSLRREDALKLYELAYNVPGDILELGCDQGLSTSILAQATRDARLQRAIVSVNFRSDYLARARVNLAIRGLIRMVDFHCGDAGALCIELAHQGRRFSFVFVDHDYSYDAVRAICLRLSELLVEGGFCLFHDFNDARNRDERQTGYGVARAVNDCLDKEMFAFYGIYGCSALYRRR